MAAQEEKQISQAERAQQLGGSIASEATSQAAKTAISKVASGTATTAAKTAGTAAAKTAISAAAGAATGGVATAIQIGANLAGKLIPQEAQQKIKDAVKGAIIAPAAMGAYLGAGIAGAFSAALGGIVTAGAEIGLTLLLAVIIVPTAITLILFIINSGAYLVPPSDTATLSRLSIPPSGCFFENPILTCGSYDSPFDPCHGTNSYWDFTGYDHCQFSLPVTDTRTVNVQGATVKYCKYNARNDGSYCYRPESQCLWYGFAADFSYANIGNFTNTRNLPVYLPTLEGETVTWTQAGFVGTNSAGSYGILRATANGRVYEMYLHHLNASPLGGSSGTQTSTLFDGLRSNNRHVHTELRIDGEFVRPEEYFCTGE